MSTRLLYHGFGVRGYRCVKTAYVEGAVAFTIEQPRESYACPLCGSGDVIGRGRNGRRRKSAGRERYGVKELPPPSLEAWRFGIDPCTPHDVQILPSGRGLGRLTGCIRRCFLRPQLLTGHHISTPGRIRTCNQRIRIWWSGLGVSHCGITILCELGCH
jgi:hypothetical protein